eukprot:1680348-Pyramimonas_sp.AAC.1
MSKSNAPKCVVWRYQFAKMPALAHLRILNNIFLLSRRHQKFYHHYRAYRCRRCHGTAPAQVAESH